MRTPFIFVLLIASATHVLAQDSEDSQNRYEKPSIGIVSTSLETAKSVLGKAKLPGVDGVMILGVYPKSGAAVAGLKPFDIVTMIGSKRVSSPKELASIVDESKIGDTLVIKGYGYNPIKNVFRAGTVKAPVKSLRDVLTGAVKAESDSVTGRIFYESPIAPDLGERSAIELYVSAKDSDINPRVRLSIRTKDWVFAQKIYLKSGDALIEKDINALKGLVDRKTKVLGADKLLEWYDWTMDDNLEAAIEQACKKGELLIRFDGRTERAEFNATIEDIASLRLMMDFINMKREDSR